MQLIKILKNHIKYTLIGYIYILKVSISNLSLFFIAIKISFKFLYCAGLINLIYKKKYFYEKDKYIDIIKNNLVLSNDWFSHNITTWVGVFKKENFYQQDINILEIGSYEGSSAVFFLNYFEKSKITCVETFKGSDEHGSIDFNKVKKNFDYNLNKYKDRLLLVEDYSSNFFKKKSINIYYDLIYIDGSHHFDDVYNDADHSFRYLKKDGLLIFDDFLKKYYKDLKKDPIAAIMKFIIKHKKNIKIINFGYQIIIKKIN